MGKMLLIKGENEKLRIEAGFCQQKHDLDIKLRIRRWRRKEAAQEEEGQDTEMF